MCRMPIHLILPDLITWMVVPIGINEINSNMLCHWPCLKQVFLCISLMHMHRERWKEIGFIEVLAKLWAPLHKVWGPSLLLKLFYIYVGIRTLSCFFITVYVCLYNKWQFLKISILILQILILCSNSSAVKKKNLEVWSRMDISFLDMLHVLRCFCTVSEFIHIVI